MTKPEFVELIKRLLELMASAKRSLLLLFDNSNSPNLPSWIQATRINYKQPSSVSLIQPLDADIIHNFKINYPIFLFKYFIECTDHQVPNTPNMKVSLDFITAVRQKISESKCAKCWKHFSFLTKPYSASIATNVDLNAI